MSSRRSPSVIASPIRLLGKPRPSLRCYAQRRGVFFDRNGNIKLLFTDLSAPKAPIAGMTSDLGQMVTGAGGSWWQQILNVL